MQTNKELVDEMIKLTGVANSSQLAAYLSKKYGANITRQNINQFQSAERMTVTNLMFREALQAALKG